MPQMMCDKIVVPVPPVGSCHLVLMGISRLEVSTEDPFITCVPHSLSNHPGKV